MYLFFQLWLDTLNQWFPSWEHYGESIKGWLIGADEAYGDSTLVLLADFHKFQLPDWLYLIGCILIVLLSLVALFALFKWMFTLVWRLFKID